MSVSKKSINNLRPAKKGEVRNPSGRPQGSLSAKTVIKKWLNVELTAENPLTGLEEKLTALDVSILKQVQKAMQGDTPAFKELMDRSEGKAMQAMEITSKKDIGEMDDYELKDVSTEELIRYLDESGGKG